MSNEQPNPPRKPIGEERLEYIPLLEKWRREAIELETTLGKTDAINSLQHVLIVANLKRILGITKIDETKASLRLQGFHEQFVNYQDLWISLKNRAMVKAIRWRAEGRDRIKVGVREATTQEINDGYPSPKVAVTIENVSQGGYTVSAGIDALRQFVQVPELIRLIGMPDPWPEEGSNRGHNPPTL